MMFTSLLQDKGLLGNRARSSPFTDTEEAGADFLF